MDADGPSAASAGLDADVVIVGYGPVGQVLSILLATRGWRVIVAEQWPNPFPLPRAVAFDGYAARVLASLGVAKTIEEIGEATPDYLVENASGQTLLRLELAVRGRNGWPESTSMYQPGLEAGLARRGAELGGLRLLRGHRVVDVVDEGSFVRVASTVAQGKGQAEITGRLVVGCDGANSVVRASMGPAERDFGFSVDWMACDVVANRAGEFPTRTLHIADPACPRVAVSAGPGHLRFEFMRLPDEPRPAFDSLPGAWARLARFGVHRENATLERYAVYTIRARCAEQWRARRVLIAGDAAHEMPPFAGQGLSTGIGDAANLAWKIHAVLSGATESLLDTYTEERKPRALRAIDISLRLGQAICTIDSAAAAARDTAMLRTVGRPPPGVPDGLASGFLHRDSLGRPAPLAGRLVPHASLATSNGSTTLDGLARAGGPFVLLTGPVTDGQLDQLGADLLPNVGIRHIEVVPQGATLVNARQVIDVDEVYLPWLQSLRAFGVVVRPDYFVFGSGADPGALLAVGDDLRQQLTTAS